MEDIYLGLGSNMGDRLQNLRDALEHLGKVITLGAKSTVYESEPMYVETQPRFLNMVVHGTTELSPRALLNELRAIEKRLGRLEAIHNGPRPLDLDILLYGSQTVDEPTLTIPHARMHERAFVIVPLAEIAPMVAHPTLSKVFADFEDQLGDYSRDVWPYAEL